MTDDKGLDFQQAQKRRVADTVMKELGLNAEDLAAVAETAPKEIRDAFYDCLQRNAMYKSIGRQRAAEEEASGTPGDRCCNVVCPSFKQSEFEVETPTEGGCIRISCTGKQNYCTGGVDRAQGCTHRMKEMPPSDPFRSDIPSHQEAVNMLMRAGLLEPDEFGHFNGTDLAHRAATRSLWWAYVDLLAETGKIPIINWTDEDGVQLPDRGAVAQAAKHHLFGGETPAS
jgi:hypothetical protein